MLASRKAPKAPALIGAERASDYAPVHALNAAAFGAPVEADLVDRLRREAGLRCEFDVPVAAFTAIELERNYLAGVFGTVSCHAAFQDV